MWVSWRILQQSEVTMTATTDRDHGLRVEDMGSASLSNTHRLRVTAPDYPQAFQIDVAVPAMMQPGQRLPVIYVLDGNWSFPLVAQIARALTLGPGGLPPAIIVGIGYAISGPMAFGATAALRYRDLAVGVDDAHIAEVKPHMPSSVWSNEMPVGQGHRFMGFIQDRLKPLIASRFDVDGSDQTLIGVSLGGLFVLRTLFEEPTAFQRYVAVSPAIWWNDCALLDTESEASAAGRIAGRLFMGVGSDEQAQAPPARMVMNLVEMAARLRANCSDLKLSTYVFPEEGHMSVPPAGISRGLRAVFAP